jgi:hypothetical protein
LNIEQVPQSWLQVGDALQKQQHACDGIGNCVLPAAEAATKVRSVLQAELGIDVGLARLLDEGGVKSSLEFWSLLGRVFIHDRHFLSDQRIKNRLQEQLLCTVWFDKAEMGSTDAFINEMKRGMANPSAFVMCLSPL